MSRALWPLAVLGVMGTFGACGGSVATGPGPDGGVTPADGGAQGTDATATLDVSAQRIPKVHRASATPCPTARGPGQTCTLGAGPCQCTKDADCTQGTNGRCLPGVGGPLYYQCSYDQCFSDSDCAGNVPCECRTSASDPSPNVCVTVSACRIDADCGPGGYCSPSGFGSFCGPPGYFCHTPADTCIDDSDCGNQICLYDPTSARWACHASCPPPP